MAVFFAALFWIAVILIGYHLIKYPILLAIWARIHPKPVKKGEFFPRITVIIPAYNEGGVIQEKIYSILNSRYPPDCLEIIVVEDGSTDQTAQKVLDIQDRRVHLNHSAVRGGKMAAINRAVQQSTSSFLVFTDANAMLLPETLQNLLSNFADPEVGCVTGRKTVAGKGEVQQNENIYWRYEAMIKRLESKIGSTPAAVGELQAVRREAFRLPDKKIINDDFQITLNTIQQGYRAIYDHSAVTVERGSASIASEQTRKSRMAAGRWQVLEQVARIAPEHPWFFMAFFSHKLLRLLIFPLMLLAFVSNLAAILINPAPTSGLAAFITLAKPWGMVFFSAQLAVYLLAVLGAIFDHFGLRVKPLYFLYYFIMAQVASFSGFLRFSQGNQTVLWKKEVR
jgi:poly-beta-1,6-N-acetyl-D-glucosamine synthase